MLATLLLLALSTQSQAQSHGSPQGRWELRTYYGLERVGFQNSTFRIVQPDYRTDVTVTGVAAQDGTGYEWLIRPPIRPDEPQHRTGFILTDLKHDVEYELALHHIRFSTVEEQIVHYNGLVNGEPVDADLPWGEKVDHLRSTNGLNGIFVKFNKPIRLASGAAGTLSAVPGIGLGVFVPFTTSRLVAPDGEIEERSGPYHLAGYGATFQTRLQYDFRRVSVGAFAALTGVKMPNVLIPSGHAQQTTMMHEGGAYLSVLVLRPKRRRPAGRW